MGTGGSPARGSSLSISVRSESLPKRSGSRKGKSGSGDATPDVVQDSIIQPLPWRFFGPRVTLPRPFPSFGCLIACGSGSTDILIDLVACLDSSSFRSAGIDTRGLAAGVEGRATTLLAILIKLN